MNNKIVKIVLLLLLFVTFAKASFAKTDKFIINDDTFIFDNKDLEIFSYFDSNYNDTENKINEKDKLKQEIKELSKKTTYLLLGKANNINERSEDYFKRHHDYLNLRYNPEVPKDENTISGLDENTQEYKDDLLSGISVPGMFSKINEFEIKYNSYGNIKVLLVNDVMAVGVILLENVSMKEPDSEDASKYNNVQTNLSLTYYFKKLNNEYKLLYLYGETSDDIEEFIAQRNEKLGKLSNSANNESQLKDLYNFSKANEIKNDTLNEIYNKNKSNVVFLSALFNTGIITSANGFFINDGIIITTYNFIEQSLIKAQNIIISNCLGENYELDGIITMNKEKDIAILKIKNKNNNHISIENVENIASEDAVITLNSKEGIGLTTSKGIVTVFDNDIQTSIPISQELQGSPLFNVNGKLIGMINSKALNTSVSYATGIKKDKEYFDKIFNMNYENIKCTSFEEIKKNYYIKYGEEDVINNIPEEKWIEYSKVENIENNIKLKLIKGSYKDGIISLRYKNEINKYIDTMQIVSEYIENLKNKGYREQKLSDSKSIYQNDKYKIVIMSEFDYLIVVMVKL